MRTLPLASAAIGLALAACQSTTTVAPPPSPLPVAKPAPLNDLKTAPTIRIAASVIERSIAHAPVPAEFTATGSPVVIEPERGFELFGPQVKGVDLMAAPAVVTKTGRDAELHIGRNFVHPDGETVTQLGTTLSIRPRYSGSPDRFVTDFDFKLVEYEGDKDGTPQFLVLQQKADDLTLTNGSYILIGTREEIQHVEDKLPILGDIPIISSLFRDSHTHRFTTALAVRLVAETP